MQTVRLACDPAPSVAGGGAPARDAVVIGGGPAGLAAAIAMRRRGLDCLVADHRPPPIDKACGEGLMPDALAALRELGVEVAPEDGALFAGIRFTDGRHTIDATFPGGPGIGVRRIVLHRRLVEEATRVGVALRWGSSADIVRPGLVQVGSELVRCRWVVGADGFRSEVRRTAGLEAGRHHLRRYATRRHYQRPPWSDHVEIHWTARGQFYVTPVGPREICVVFITRWPVERLDPALAACPHLAARLDGAPVAAPPRGALSITATLRRVVTPTIALVGDASGSVDAITGDGLLLAFRQADALASAMAGGDLAAYGRAHRRVMRRPLWMARLLLTMDGWPAVGRRALPALARTRTLFRELLAVHTGGRLRATVLAAGGVRLGYRLLAHGGTDDATAR